MCAAGERGKLCRVKVAVLRPFVIVSRRPPPRPRAVRRHLFPPEDRRRMKMKQEGKRGRFCSVGTPTHIHSTRHSMEPQSVPPPPAAAHALVEAACVAVQACRRGQLARRRVLALLNARADVRDAHRTPRPAARRAAPAPPAAAVGHRGERGEASAELHVHRQRAGDIADGTRRRAAEAEARRGAASPCRNSRRSADSETDDSDDDVDDELLAATCLELRAWARCCPESRGIAALLAECEGPAQDDQLAITCAELQELTLHSEAHGPAHAQLTSLLGECNHGRAARANHALGAAADTQALASTIDELRALSGGDDSLALAALVSECTAEAVRREIMSRTAAVGELLATGREMNRLLSTAAAARGSGSSPLSRQLHGLREECEREVRSRHPDRAGAPAEAGVG